MYITVNTYCVHLQPEKENNRDTTIRSLLELFKCKNLILRKTDILRQIVLLPASLQILHRHCDFVFGTLNTMYIWNDIVS